MKALMCRRTMQADVILQPRRGGFTAILQSKSNIAAPALYNLAVEYQWKIMRIANGAYKVWERGGENTEALSSSVAHYLSTQHNLSVAIED